MFSLFESNTKPWHYFPKNISSVIRNKHFKGDRLCKSKVSWYFTQIGEKVCEFQFMCNSEFHAKINKLTMNTKAI